MPAIATAAAVRAVRVALPGAVPAEHAALLVADDDRAFALVGRWAGAAALAGSAPVRVAGERDDPFALVGRWAGAAALAGSAPVRVAGERDDPFALLDDQPPLGEVPEGFVGGGWFGVLGYGLGRRLEALGPPPPAPERLPAAVLGFYDHVLRLDRAGRWWFEALWSDAREGALRERLQTLRARLAAGVAGPARVATGAWRATPSPTGHARAVAACRERIAAGDLFQANLSLRLRAPLLHGTPADLFTRGVAGLRPDRAAFVAGAGGALASLSPELFVERHGERVRSAPIKGTRPRPAGDAAAAEAQRAALAASAKDHAENIMIVDLVRNDLGRVCAIGSVHVTALADVRAHAGVWHLVSEVEGRRLPGLGDGTLVAAMFPPGSVTGAPKIAAMDVISALESHERQAFCGAIGFASPAAGLELSVAIRTFEVRDGAAWLDVGGGVVADSDPAAEAAECLAKARPLLAAIGAQLAEDDGDDGEAEPAETRREATPVPLPLRLGTRPVPRPDPARGVFETLLVSGGRAVAAERHLARLAASARDLYGLTLPGALPAQVQHAALEQGGPCRLRILLDADGTVALDARALTSAGAPLRVQPVTVPGGIGAHKWRDRRLLEALEAAVAPATPLLVDLDGMVLETTRSCVFALRGDALLTPPADGRILPGVARGRVLDAAPALGFSVQEAELTLDALRTADAAFATNALRGVQPIAAVGASPLNAADDRVRTLAGLFLQME